MQLSRLAFVVVLLLSACGNDASSIADAAIDAAIDTVTMDAAPADARLDATLDSVDAQPNDADAAPDADVDVIATWGLDTRPTNTTCVAFARPTSGTSVTFTEAFASLPQVEGIVALLQAPGDSSRWFQITLDGRVLSFSNTPNASARVTVLDITTRVYSGGELGLLGIAFHPNFATNGEVFLSYTALPREGMNEAAVSRLSRFRSSDGGATLSPASEEILLETSQPYTNHNGGWIGFGPDGLLYYGLGDGGSGGDPRGNGQNLNSVLGKMLRIDVDHPSAGRMYGIPSDNPFASGTGGRPEIYAWGLRNPWRCSFDSLSGELWAGDVGQNRYEEVDVIRRGANYGWNVMEGLHCYNAATCDQAGLTLPVVEYDHSLGASITGGHVYRGARVPWLAGSYLFGDYVSGRVWRVAYSPAGVAFPQELGDANVNFGAFGQGVDGEVYVISISDGRLLRIDPGAVNPNDTVPATIRATGCVDRANPLNPAVGLIPYTPNAPFWSDGAQKERFIALPNAATISVNADGDWDLPVGTVLVKNFTYAGRRIETRLFIRHQDGEWAGYSYRWNDAQTDAVALPASDTRMLSDGTQWNYPSRAQCMGCHTAAAGRTLGLETAQLNGTITYASTGRSANQLSTLAHIGIFAEPFNTPIAALPALVSPTGGAALEERARAYLHTNCSMCHRPGGTGRGTADFRYSTSLPMLGVCNAAPTAGDLGVSGARLLTPGDPSHSLLAIRVAATNASRMPPISSNVVDTAGVTLLEEWIRSMRTCP